MSLRLNVVRETDHDLAWKFAKVLAGGSVLAALLWWNPIPLDILVQLVLVLLLPILLVTAFVGLAGWDAVASSWNELASGGFSRRVEEHLRVLRQEVEEPPTVT